MQTYTRKPIWTVTIKRPDYSAPVLKYQQVKNWVKSGTYSTNKVQFVSSPDRINETFSYGDMISYEYDNTIASPLDVFSLTFVPEQDKSGLTWKDKLRARDIVFISEFGKIRYIGIIKKTSYQASMNSEKPMRRIIVSGESIGGMLQSFQLPMNVYLWDNLGVDKKSANQALVDALSSQVTKGQDITGILELIKDNFIKVALKTTGGFASLLNKFLVLGDTSLKVFYPMNFQPYQEDNNTLWSIYKMILPQPTYEIFGRYEDEKYNLIVRETPFDAKDWDSLKITPLNPLYLIEHDLNDSDDEVYTHFYSQMPNAVLTEQQNWANNSLNEVSVFDEEKKSIYGFRQLEANFPFYNKLDNAEFDPKDFLKNNSVRLYAWYKNNDEFLSGQITMMTVPDKDNEYIKIGERIQYMQGSSNSIEFYVEGIKRKAEYNGIMSSTFTSTRGYEYNKRSRPVTIDGVTVQTPQVQRVAKLGKKLRQTERAEYRLER